MSNIAEGFAQPTDRAFANYLYISKASVAEVRARLKLAFERRYITKHEFDVRDSLADEIARMSTGLIRYLIKSNRRRRGIGRDGSVPKA